MANDSHSLLTIEHLTHRYNARTPRPVLSDITLEIGVDDIMALVGESGCGKTTLGKIVAGLVRPTEGSVQFHDKDIFSLRGSEYDRYRRSVQFIHQDPYASLNPALTIEETLSAGLKRYRLVTGKRETRDRVEELIRTVGLSYDEDFLRRYPHQLSGGQRQRIGVARAMALNPQLIVADEAVSMLDVSVRVAILNLLLDLKETRKMSYLFITHDFGVVRHFAAGYRIGVLYYGKLVEVGLCEDIIQSPRHPYTYSLLSAVPVPDPHWNQNRPMIAIKSEDEINERTNGCPYAQRCTMAVDRCSEEEPPLMAVNDGHATACFLADQIPALGREATV